VVLSDIDRQLLNRCLDHKPNAWQDFVDRFLGLVIHVINHTAQSRSVRLGLQDREDLAAEVFLTLLENDFHVLRRFRGESSLSTYLTVISRRVVVREILKRKSAAPLDAASAAADGQSAEARIQDRDEVERLIQSLDDDEAQVVRMYHLEGKSYREISSHVGLAENSIGPTLSRARAKMRTQASETS
jgi:RNA polymerase sigma-70 factor (ECF subfamily)